MRALLSFVFRANSLTYPHQAGHILLVLHDAEGALYPLGTWQFSILLLAHQRGLTRVHNALQKEENKAKAKKAAEAEEAQKKLADIMVEAQKKVRYPAPRFPPICAVAYGFLQRN